MCVTFCRASNAFEVKLNWEIFANDYLHLQILITGYWLIIFTLLRADRRLSWPNKRVFRCVFGIKIKYCTYWTRWLSRKIDRKVRRWIDSVRPTWRSLHCRGDLSLINHEFSGAKRRGRRRRMRTRRVFYLSFACTRGPWSRSRSRGENLICHDCPCFQCRQIREASKVPRRSRGD